MNFWKGFYTDHWEANFLVLKCIIGMCLLESLQKPHLGLQTRDKRYHHEEYRNTNSEIFNTTPLSVLAYIVKTILHARRNGRIQYYTERSQGNKSSGTNHISICFWSLEKNKQILVDEREPTDGHNSGFCIGCNMLDNQIIIASGKWYLATDTGNLHGQEAQTSVVRITLEVILSLSSSLWPHRGTFMIRQLKIQANFSFQRGLLCMWVQFQNGLQ